MRWFLLLLHSLSYKKCFSCACLWILGERKANTLSFTASGSDSCRTSCDTLREDPWLHHPARSISLIKKESSKPNPKLERASVSWIQIEACFHRRGAWELPPTPLSETLGAHSLRAKPSKPILLSPFQNQIKFWLRKRAALSSLCPCGWGPIAVWPEESSRDIIWMSLCQIQMLVFEQRWQSRSLNIF